MFCDIISQEMKQDLRVIELRGDFIALCPYAPRVPYETWIMPRTHEAAFERFGLNRPATMRDLAPAAAHLAAHPHHHRRFSSRAAYFTQQPAPFGESGLLEDHRRGLSLAHRDHARTCGEGEIVHLQRGVLFALSSETAVKRLRDARIEP